MVTHYPTKPPLAARARTALLWLLTAALVYSQVIGAMHGVVHVHLLESAATAADQQSVTTARISGDAPGWQALLFGGHDDIPTCRVFDSLGHGDAVALMPVSLLPFALPFVVPRLRASSFFIRWTPPFGARGPPVAR